MRWNEIERKLVKQGLVLFTSQEFRRAANLTTASAKFLLIRYAKKGLILKLKNRRGLYCLHSTPPHPWVLANRLLKPSYISFETALSFYGGLPETVYAITSVTTQNTRTFESQERSYTYQKIKGSAYLGYSPILIEGETVLIADKEKALADYLYFVHLKKKTLNDRLKWDVFDKNKTLGYLNQFHRKKLKEWAGHVIGSNN